MVEASVFSYIATHLPRSFATIQKVLNLADSIALQKGRRITIPVIREAIGQIERMI